VPGSIRTTNGTPKGYKLEWFLDAFERYLAAESATPPQSAVGAALKASPSRHIIENVAVPTSAKSAQTLLCGGVADEIPGVWSVGGWRRSVSSETSSDYGSTGDERGSGFSMGRMNGHAQS
jgi:hypothetical protein